DRLPAEAGQAVEQRLDAALAVESRRAQVVEAETELLVLCADAPVGARSRAAGQVFDQLAPVGDRGFGDAAGTRHDRMIRGSGGSRDHGIAASAAPTPVPASRSRWRAPRRRPAWIRRRTPAR